MLISKILRPTVKIFYHANSSISFVIREMHSSLPPTLPVNWSAFVLCSSSSDTDPTVVLNFESARYIFNAGEGTTRAFLQSTLNWRKSKCIFLSRVATERSAGIPGLLMTLADNAIETVKVIGPCGLLHFLASMRLYVQRDTMSVEPMEIPPLADSVDPSKPVFHDDNIIVYAVVASHKPDFTDGGLKRKQEEDVGNANPKRHQIESTLEEPPLSLNTSVPELSDAEYPHSASDSAGFTPLSGDDWRKSIIQSMFKRPQSETQTSPGPNFRSLSRRAAYDRMLPRWISQDDRASSSEHNFSHIAKGQSVSYIIHGPRIRGKFDAKKAAELGLKPGPLRGKVARGETVEFKIKLANGSEETRRVSPEDCLGPPEKIVAVFIIDCPTTSHIEELVNSSQWSAYQTAAKQSSDLIVHAIFHLVGDGVLEDSRYRGWMNTFSSSTHHLIANKQYCSDPVTFTNAAFYQLKLHQLDQELFPLQSYNLTPPSSLKAVPDLPPNTQPMQANHFIELRHHKPPIIDPQADHKDIFHRSAKLPMRDYLSEKTLAQFRDAQISVRAAAAGLAKVEGDVTIIPLGTSSATPSKYRNVSSTLLKIPKYGNILLDCGEGTWGQLARQFGTVGTDLENVYNQLRDLKCIFISHLHGDHHIGLSKVLRIRKNLNPQPSEPLYLIAERGVHLYLREYSDLEDIGLLSPLVKVVFAEDLHWQSRLPSQKSEQYSEFMAPLNIPSRGAVINDLRQSLGVHSFETVDVMHRTKCYGAVIKHVDGWSLTFSGDTMPSQNLVNAGKNSSVLIHEATMGDDEIELAKKKAHSTVGEAIDIGTRMNAQNILLTHFSARYPKMPPNQKNPDSANTPIIALALDHLRIPLHSLWKINMYLSAIEYAYSDVDESETCA